MKRFSIIITIRFEIHVYRQSVKIKSNDFASAGQWALLTAKWRADDHAEKCGPPLKITTQIREIALKTAKAKTAKAKA